MAKDVSVEYAHIYTNQHISEEQEASIKILSMLSEELKAQAKDSSLVVMVDDYSFPDPSFDYSNFAAWLKAKGFGPDVLVRESQLIPACDEVLKMVSNTRLKEQVSDYIKLKKYPCSLFIAAWYLLRLGKLNSKQLSKDLQAKQLINILPESYKPFEDKGLEIISATPHKNSINSIRYIYLPGRLIA